MIDLLSTNWTWILIGLGLMVVFLFLYKAGVFDRRSKRVTLKSSLRDGDVLYMSNNIAITYYDGFPLDNYDDNLHHVMYDELDIIEIIRSK